MVVATSFGVRMSGIDATALAKRLMPFDVFVLTIIESYSGIDINSPLYDFPKYTTSFSVFVMITLR